MGEEDNKEVDRQYSVCSDKCQKEKKNQDKGIVNAKGKTLRK